MPRRKMVQNQKKKTSKIHLWNQQMKIKEMTLKLILILYS
jgi:hypothetical protein